MLAEAVIYALLNGAGAVTAIAGTRIYPAIAPENTAAPLITIDLVSSVRQARIDALANTHLVLARVQVNLVAADYVTVKAMRAAVVAACQFQRGMISGASVASVLPSGDGPITFDGALGLFHQPIDFSLSLFE